MSQDLVTVCITTFNRKGLIKKCIEAVISQTYTNIEIIIVDDCSTDETEEYVLNKILVLDSRIRYIRHEHNKGLTAARNSAIRDAKGKYFTFCDDDDIWDEHFVSSFMKILEENGSDLSYCASIVSNNQSVMAIKAPISDLLIMGYTPPVASQFYSIEVLREIGGYDEEISSGVDHDLWLSLAHKNFSLMWLNEDMVKVNQNNSEDRMTYNLNKRLSGIRNSIQIWEERIGDQFGKNFFECLKKNYSYNTFKKFIILSLTEWKINKFVTYWLKLPKALLWLDFQRYLKSRFIKNSVLKSPTFFPCKMKYKNQLKSIHIVWK